jgi:alpha,alpha-trehalose-phosphate synthase [UDP-forming]
MEASQAFERLIVVSNRLPVTVAKRADGWRINPSSGGLVSALAPVLRRKGGMWIGWPGTPDAPGLDEALENATGIGCELRSVPLDRDEVEGFYYGFANEILWPLLHGFETRCNFSPSYWRTYLSANARFARRVADSAGDNDFVWIQDYHLMLVGSELRKLGLGQRLAFFLHIPFPPPDIFLKLPWRAEILEGLLAFDLIGFHTLRDRRNFVACLQELKLPDLKVAGRGDVQRVRFGDRSLRVGAFPISIDFEEMNRASRSDEVTQAVRRFREGFGTRQVVLGMDRLDYTKGIPERLEAFRTLLRKHEDLRSRITLVQLTVPSRENVPEYERLRGEIERLTGEINGEFTDPGGWVPVQYLHRSLDRVTTCAYLRGADIALITPLRDGMNLVAKEYCACDIERDGALILSEFAGAAAELKNGALLVNPYDTEGVAEAIYRAYSMSRDERHWRMTALRNQIRRNDVFAWVDSVLTAATQRQLDTEPRLEDYSPSISLSERFAVGTDAAAQ